MNFIVTLLILIVILGLIVFIHEFGHFIAAKKSGVPVYEFAIGMGPKIFGFKRKNDETEYTIRLLPLGGYNSLANDNETAKDIKKDRILENKSYLTRFLILVMGIIFNFILAIILLFINGLIYGSPETKPYIGEVVSDTPAYTSGLKEDDLVLKINGKEVNSFDEVLLETKYNEGYDTFVFTVLRGNEELDITITPSVEDDTKVFGFKQTTKRNYGLINALKYGVVSTYKNTISVFNILGKLLTGKVSANNLSGPIGVFSVIDNIKSSGLESLIYLTAYLSINVAVINLIPIPVFDGGRILLLLIEKIKGNKLNPKIESVLNTIGVIIILVLVVFVTLNDILKLF